jgi:aspartate dehydrogenase
MKKLGIGIIGCGAIGSALARIIHKKFPREACITHLCDRRIEKAQALARELGGKITVCSLEVLLMRADLVLEAASTVVARQVAMLAWKYQKNVMIMSVGGLLGLNLPISKTTKFRIWIPSGALCGVDGLLAAREAGLKSVTLITRKPPIGLNEAPYFKKRPFPKLKGNREVRIFRGNALQAVANFPQNINVGAVLSVAGMGPIKTKVELWTSNAYRRNQHEVFIEAKSGTIRTVTENVPSKENPKTSALAVYAAVATLRKMFSAVRVGT